MNLGGTINKLRKEKKMTLVELAEKSGVALATLSRMENDKMTGTLESHMKICEALGVPLPELYKNLYAFKKAVDIYTKKSPAEVFAHDKKSSEEILASKVLSKKMMPVLIKIHKNGKTHIAEAKPNIEKFLYVLEGKIEVNIGEEKYNLMKGDTLYFEALSSHFFRNLSNQESRLLCIISPPLL
ncbi:MAG: XRE family transcriptional regulator [Candidatus Omnitrophota bacterium]|nr:XRE family transcriptional regulator [Candidatus Omnitrophota bacterium]